MMERYLCMYSAAVLTLLVTGATLTAAQDEVRIPFWLLGSFLHNPTFNCVFNQMSKAPIGSATFNSTDVTFTIDDTCSFAKSWHSMEREVLFYMLVQSSHK
jgi:hypothetical protein